jgi:MoaA/NifB/PqqE/SkfB family radical SAM enzyme
MKKTMKILKVFTTGHSIGQKLNYVKYLFSRKGEVLGYDPLVISIVATGRCTLSCDMCPTHSRMVSREYPYLQRTANDMSLGMFKDIIDRYRNAMTVHIIGSGEPLLNKDFFKMVDYAVSRKMSVKTFSNGTTIKEHIDDILNSGLDGITISLNGHNAAEFRRMTGMEEKVYSDIYEAAGLLINEKKRRRSNVKIKLSFIIDRQNYRQIPEMVDAAVKLGADHAFFCNFLSSPYSGLKAEERVLNHDLDTVNELKTIFGRYPKTIRKLLTPPVLLDASMKENMCDIHFQQIRFDGDGNTSSCSMMLLDMTGHGSYKDDGAWNNEFFRGMRSAFLSGSGGDLEPPCRVCPDNKGAHIRK